jgi:membrane protein
MRSALRATWSQIHDKVKARLLALGLVLGIGFLMMVSLLLSTALAALGKWWAPWFGEYTGIAHAMDWLLSFSLISAIFAMIYKWVPQVKIAWRDVRVGAAITAWLFTVGKTLFGLYIGRSGVASPFGAAASLVVLLWVYYSAQIFLLGAEMTWLYSHRHGSRKNQDPDAPRGAPVAARPRAGALP